MRIRRTLKRDVLNRVSAICLILLTFSSLADETFLKPAEESLEGKKSQTFVDRSWLSIDLSVFEDHAGLANYPIPSGTDLYQQTFHFLSSRISAGHQVTPEWAVELQIHSGPTEAYNASRKGVDLYSSSVKRHFVSLLATREFSVGNEVKLDTKIGVARSSFRQREWSSKLLSTKFRSVEIRPVASIGVRMRFTPRISAGTEFTHYFLHEQDSVTSLGFGVRFSF